MLTIICFDVKIIVYYKDRDGDSSIKKGFQANRGWCKPDNAV